MEPEWPQIETLFEAALEEPPDERGAWLEANGDDPQLRAAAQRLLMAHERSSGILDAPLYPPTHDPADASSKSDAGRRDAGQRIGPYCTVGLLGHGGMGSVYLANRADGQFEQQVALKWLGIAFPSSGATGRFLAERQILATLSHPNITRLPPAPDRLRRNDHVARAANAGRPRPGATRGPAIRAGHRLPDRPVRTSGSVSGRWPCRTAWRYFNHPRAVGSGHRPDPPGAFRSA